MHTDMASLLYLSGDQVGFYVGYKSCGVIEKYSIGDGSLLWSTEAHPGDVNTVIELQPGLLCTAGADCRVCQSPIGFP